MSDPTEVKLLDLGKDDEDFARYESRKRTAVENGDKAELLHFISACFWTGRVVPQWAQERFQNAVKKVQNYEVKSWEEVFGRPLKKGKQLAAERRRKQLGGKIFNRVNVLGEAGEPISKSLFEHVGSEFGVSCTVAEEIYYKQLNSIRDFVALLRPEAQRKLIAFVAAQFPEVEAEIRALASAHTDHQEEILHLLNPGKI